MRIMTQLGRVFAVAGAIWMAGSVSTMAVAAEGVPASRNVGDIIRKATAPFSTTDLAKVSLEATSEASNSAASREATLYCSIPPWTPPTIIDDWAFVSYDPAVDNEIYLGGSYFSSCAYENGVEYVYWVLSGNLGSPNSCSGTVYQCGNGTYYVPGCDVSATLYVYLYDSSWDQIHDYTKPVWTSYSC